MYNINLHATFAISWNSDVQKDNMMNAQFIFIRNKMLCYVQKFFSGCHLQWRQLIVSNRLQCVDKSSGASCVCLKRRGHHFNWRKCPESPAVYQFLHELVSLSHTHTF